MITLSLLMAGSAWAAPKRIMVYPIKNLAQKSPNALVTLRDAIRTVAGEQLSARHFKIIDNANLTVFTDGKTWAQCKSGTKCEIETARKINLDYFIVGRLTVVEKRLFITVQAWTTETGAQVGSFQVEGDSLLALKAAMTQRLPALMSKISAAAGVPRGVSSPVRVADSTRDSAPKTEWLRWRL